MSEKLIEIHGFASQTGGNVVGVSKSFKFFELDIPELHFPSSEISSVSLDIIATVLISRSTVPANVGKQATRRIQAVASRGSTKEITVVKTVSGVVVDSEMEWAQTLLTVEGNRVCLGFTGTSAGTLFSCSASIRYTATGEVDNKKKGKVNEFVDTSLIVDYPNSAIAIDHNDLDGRSIDACHPASAVTYDPINSGMAADDVQDAIDELDGRVDIVEGVTDVVEDIIDSTHEPTGFEWPTGCSLSYNAGARTFTITPNVLGAGSTCFYWINGVRYQLTAAVTSTPHADTSMTYYFYFNSSNVATVSANFWDFSITCPIAFVLFDTTTTPEQAILCDERHRNVMDWATHAHLHFSKGAFVRSGFAIDDTSYVLNSSVAAEKKFKIGDGYLVDEDITFYHDDSYIQVALPANRRYAMLYRAGASGTWTWSKDELFPVLWDSVTTYDPYYNQYTGGAWQLTLISDNNRWFNVFTCVTNSTDPYYKIVNIVGQVLHTSLASAEEESILSLSWGDVPFQEIAPIYQTSFRRGPYGGVGNPDVRIEAVQKIIGVSITLTGLLASNHASLAGRDLPNSHPATAISYDIASGISDLYSTDTQHAIEELAEQMGRCVQSGTVTRDVDGNVTEVLIENPKGDMQITITRDGDGNATQVVKEYTDGVDTYTRTITISRDGDGYVTGWETV